jgi:predicted TIM-barrel fold metal-dependent hydrolase
MEVIFTFPELSLVIAHYGYPIPEESWDITTRAHNLDELERYTAN